MLLTFRRPCTGRQRQWFFYHCLFYRSSKPFSLCLLSCECCSQHDLLRTCLTHVAGSALFTINIDRVQGCQYWAGNGEEVAINDESQPPLPPPLDEKASFLWLSTINQVFLALLPCFCTFWCSPLHEVKFYARMETQTTNQWQCNHSRSPEDNVRQQYQ